MTNEEKYVVNPLFEWFKRQKAEWILTKNSGTRRGWDIEASRKNQDLLIEAKYFSRSFIGSFNGLVTAPLTNRPQRRMETKYRSWCSDVCWAIGSSYKKRNIYQILFDYISRNIKFWENYRKDLHLKYVFFVCDKRVAKVSFVKLLYKAKIYEEKCKDKSIKEKRKMAESLMKRYQYT